MKKTGSPKKSNGLCPCCSGKLYADCCGPLHQGEFPPNALALMRSRYSAYALQNVSYIMRTTDSANPSWQVDQAKWGEEILHFCQNTEFQKLEILDFSDGTDTATVTFIAHLRQDKKPFQLKEKSLFVKKGPQWLYKEGIS